MKKKTLTILLCVFLCLSFICGCSRNKKFTADEICDSLAAQLFKNCRTTVLDEKEIQNYFAFTPEAVKNYKAVICEKNESYDIVVSFEGADKKSSQTLVTNINNAMLSSANIFRELNEIEYNRIKSRLFYEKDGVYTLVVADNYDIAEKYFKEIGAKKVKQ